MSLEEKRMVKMLFDYKTVTATDFNSFNMEKMSLPPYEKHYMIKPPKPKPCYKPLKDLQTINDFKEGATVPFTLWIKPNDITRGDPNKIQKLYKTPKDKHLEEVIRTRPRIVMTPAISLDDITDLEQRKKLVEGTYVSTAMKGLGETAAIAFPGDSVRAPYPDRPAPTQPITLPKMQYAYVCPSWRMTSMKWDTQQVRSFVEPTTEFWTRRPIDPCMICMATAARNEKEKLRRAGNK